ncbi:hypothetical protein [Methyloraptor flagellatus]|uniref:Uncharacterized protein n=1 Tax=Methyloraptor flagellatus TaxID=3162530 RepID=A0AAU7XBD0_9HYPH
MQLSDDHGCRGRAALDHGVPLGDSTNGALPPVAGRGEPSTGGAGAI